MSNETDNVLVSREKLEKLIAAVEYMSTCQQLRGSNQGQYKAILSMPDFIESERDVSIVETAIVVAAGEGDYMYYMPDENARVAINALRYRKDGRFKFTYNYN